MCPDSLSARPVEDNGTVVRPRKHAFDQFDRPGSVRIDVRGAYIVDEDSASPQRTESPPRHASESRDIRLPHHKADVSHIAVDIGGSLAKLVYFTRDPSAQGGKLNFKSFETEKIDDLIDYMDALINGKSRTSPPGTSSTPYVMATGGGAYKFYDKIRNRLGVEIFREDEMNCLIVGLDFFITEIPEEVFTYSEEDPMQFTETRLDIYPYLLVNIGSGVSMIKVSGPQQYERIGGSSLGGGTLWGLLSMLTPAKSFDDMLALAERGENSNVDMMVGDIYGGDYPRIGLKSTTIASSFGKVFKKQREATDGGSAFKAEDISRSLLYAVSNNIGQLAYLNAARLNLEHIYFGGSFIRGHRQTMNTLTYGLKFWSKGEKKAYFLRHEGYLGAVGAFLRQQPKNWGRRYSAGQDNFLR